MCGVCVYEWYTEPTTCGTISKVSAIGCGVISSGLGYVNGVGGIWDMYISCNYIYSSLYTAVFMGIEDLYISDALFCDYLGRKYVHG
jgi:hypothetical protein